jgi:cytochrome c oxidase assembly protein subunit 15
VREVRAWLIACCALIFIMVVLGGVTRLTESGLSIVEWQPLSGAIPPLSHSEWRELFDAYRQTPEFKTYNFWMELADFQAIFWMEYAHRLLGRVIGLVFLIGFVWFALRGRVRGRLALQLALAFVLGAAQGALGWYMVQSGLSDRADVSHYRLAAHLMLAVAIYGWLLWIVLDMSESRGSTGSGRSFAALLLCWLALTMTWGAFTAGLDAGTLYNTFPLMGGDVVPPGAFDLEPAALNLFENGATVQFVHRGLAIGFVLLALWFWLRSRSRPSAWLGGMALLQAGLGVATLLSVVAVPIAAAHQAGAMVLFSLAVWCLHALSSETQSNPGS